MDLPVMPPLKPMLAQSVPEIPEGMAYTLQGHGLRRRGRSKTPA